MGKMDLMELPEYGSKKPGRVLLESFFDGVGQGVSGIVMSPETKGKFFGKSKDYSKDMYGEMVVNTITRRATFAGTFLTLSYYSVDNTPLKYAFLSMLALRTAGELYNGRGHIKSAARTARRYLR
ncbi:MAG: hypothetical protein JW727_01690 [Candidatus Aenigmarchaeota archaeon]|nr:hypothetical protein [Candidatus Aenigmarchaeota archaeon]